MMQMNHKSWEREEEGTGVLSAFVAAALITFFTQDWVKEFLLTVSVFQDILNIQFWIISMFTHIFEHTNNQKLRIIK